MLDQSGAMRSWVRSQPVDRVFHPRQSGQRCTDVRCAATRMARDGGPRADGRPVADRFRICKRVTSPPTVDRCRPTPAKPFCRRSWKCGIRRNRSSPSRFRVGQRQDR